jgi:hypothetical protein
MRSNTSKNKARFTSQYFVPPNVAAADRLWCTRPAEPHRHEVEICGFSVGGATLRRVMQYPGRDRAHQNCRSCARGVADSVPSPQERDVAAAVPKTGRPPGGVRPGFSLLARRYPLLSLRRSTLVVLGVGPPSGSVSSRFPSGRWSAAACVT